MSKVFELLLENLNRARELAEKNIDEAAGGTSISKLTRISNLKKAAIGSAMSIARKQKDPLYTRYVGINKSRLQLKTKIMKKYKRILDKKKK